MRWFTPMADQLQQLWMQTLRIIPNLVVGFVVFLLLLLVARWVRVGVRRASLRLGRRRNIGLILGRLAQAVIVLVGSLVALTIAFPSFTVVDLVQFLGITSVAAGFAFRDVLQNFFAGMLILWSEPFRIGDQIVHGTFEGTIEEIQTRATLIRTYDGRRVVIPNGELFTNVVVVNTWYPTRRVEVDVGIGIGDDVEAAQALVLAAVRELPETLADPAPDVLVHQIGDFAIILRIRWWIAPPRRNDLLEAKNAVLTTVKRRLLAAGVDLPYPTTQVLFHDQTEETDGNRRKQREGWPAGTTDVPRSRRDVDAAAGQGNR